MENRIRRSMLPGIFKLFNNAIHVAGHFSGCFWWRLLLFNSRFVYKRAKRAKEIVPVL